MFPSYYVFTSKYSYFQDIFPSYVTKLCSQVNYYHQLGPTVGPNRFGPNCSKGEIRQQSKKRILNFK